MRRSTNKTTTPIFTPTRRRNDKEAIVTDEIQSEQFHFIKQRIAEGQKNGGG
jgi:hypothetical protein